MTREVWQDYDCPLSGIDFDLTDGQMVHEGMRFRCPGCGREHMANVDIEVHTYVDDGCVVSYPDLPATAEDLQRLRKG